MKEFILTQPYASLEEMLNSAEVGIYKEELQQGNIEKYAIVSRIGNRYDINGIKIEDYTENPFFAKEDMSVSYCEITNEDVVEEADITIEEILEDKIMKYAEIEKLIDIEIEKAVNQVKEKYAYEIENITETHSLELSKMKDKIKEELILKLNS